MVVILAKQIVLRVYRNWVIGWWIGCLVLMTVVPVAGQEWVDYSWVFGANQSEVRPLAVDPEGHLWVSAVSALWKFDGATWQRYTTEQGFPGNGAIGMVFNRSGQMWVSAGAELSRWDGREWAAYPYDPAHGGLEGTWTISPAVVDSMGQLWGIAWKAGPPGSITAVWRLNGERFEHPLSVGGTEQLAIDRSDHLWFAGYGVGFFDGQQVYTPYYSDSPYYEAWAPIREWHFPRIAVNLQDGHLWGAFWEGVARFDGKRWTTYPVGDYYNTILRRTVTVPSFVSIAPAPDGTMWFASFDKLSSDDTTAVPKLFHFDGINWWEYPLPANLPPNGTPRILVEGSGRIWVAFLSSLFRSIPPILTGVEEGVSGVLPRDVQLFRNVPNPFNGETTIGYVLSAAGWVQLMVYDASGQRVSTLVDQHQSPGVYQVQWGGDQQASGIYLYRLQVGRHVEWEHMVLLK